MAYRPRKRKCNFCGKFTDWEACCGVLVGTKTPMQRLEDELREIRRIVGGMIGWRRKRR